MIKPSFVIGDPENPYMLRWHLIPRNPIFNVYLHKFLRHDEDRALHDHPWWFASVILKGTYREVLRDVERCPVCGCDDWRDDGRAPKPLFCRACGEPLFIQTSWRPRYTLAFRRPTYRHRVVLCEDADGKPLPCWTLVLTGPRIREWGFWCPQGFVHWRVFTRPGNKGQVGRGCE